MKIALPVTALAAVCALAACGGGASNPPAVPGVPGANGGAPAPSPTASASAAPQSGDVQFSITVPQQSSTTGNARRPDFGVPASTASVSLALVSVNGTSQSATPTIVNLFSGKPSCTASSATLTCQTTIAAPAGSDVFLARAFSNSGAQGTLLGEGNVLVKVTGGQAVTAPATLQGTPASIVVAVGVAEFGAPVPVPVVIDVKDASGATIIGSYGTPVALHDSDTSGQTQLSTTGIPDSTSAAGITLAYKGGSLPAPAAISASTPGVAAASVTAANFTPDTLFPTVNGAENTFDTDSWTQQTVNGASPPPGVTTRTTAARVVATGASFGGITGLVGMTDGSGNSAQHSYYQWNPGSSSTALAFVGESDSSGDLQCRAPYRTPLILPLPSFWDGLKGSGACTYTSASGSTSDKATYNADGSYTYGRSVANSDGTVTTDDVVVNADGTSTLTHDAAAGSYIIGLSTPAPGATSIEAAVQTFPGPIPSPGTATPAPSSTSIPNFYALYGATPNGAPAAPLDSDDLRVVGAAALPSQCNVPQSLLGSSPAITEVDETSIQFDPQQMKSGTFYSHDTYHHYYLNGIGEVCTGDSRDSASLDSVSGYVFGGDRNVTTSRTITYRYLAGS